MVNDDFTERLLRPTLEKAEAVADTSELFARAAKLLNLAGALNNQALHPSPGNVGAVTEDSNLFGSAEEATELTGIRQTKPGQVQPIVKSLMKTLLEDYPTLLDDAGIRHLLDRDYCKTNLRLQISNLALLRRRENGIEISGHSRYWTKVYADRFHVCKEWWKKDHLANARSLLRFVTGLIEKNQGHHGVPALNKHRQSLCDYIG